MLHSFSGCTTKDGIFAYVYAVLHDPRYRQTYLQDLKRSQPRIPFYDGYEKWCDWGDRLFALHTGFGRAAPYDLQRMDTAPRKAEEAKQAPRAILRSDPKKGVIVVDSTTQLSGISEDAWRYTLAGRPAIDWVLEQHKESAPKDPIVRQKFNTYRLADHKETMIETLMRVVTVSVETLKIIDEMEGAVQAPGSMPSKAGPDNTTRRKTAAYPRR